MKRSIVGHPSLHHWSFWRRPNVAALPSRRRRDGSWFFATAAKKERRLLGAKSSRWRFERKRAKRCFLHRKKWEERRRYAIGCRRAMHGPPRGRVACATAATNHGPPSVPTPVGPQSPSYISSCSVTIRGGRYQSAPPFGRLGANHRA